MPTSMTVVATSDVDFAGPEPPHDIVAFVRLEPSVHQAHAGAPATARPGSGPWWWPRADRPARIPRSPAARRTPGGRAPHASRTNSITRSRCAPVRTAVRIGAPPRRTVPERGDVEVAVERERQRARNRRGGEQQDVGCGALADQGRPLLDAEAVLLVDDDEAQPAEAIRFPASARGSRPPAAPDPSRDAPRTACFSPADCRPSSSSGLERERSEELRRASPRAARPGARSAP